VLLSTHILPEVQQSCSRLLIINRGAIVADGPVDRLVRDAEGMVQISVEARGEGVVAALERLPGVREVEPARTAPDGRVAVHLTVGREADVRPAIFEVAKERGWTLYELHQETVSLEELFRQLTTPETQP
jgi:ABC-2 type transport system ATP-binding protein